MKKIIKLIVVMFIGFLVFSTGVTAAETIAVRRKIKNFTKLGILQEDISTNKTKYFKVSRETLGFEEEFEREPFFHNNLTQPGFEGDIFVTQQSPFPNLPGVHQFVSFYFGGHAAYVGDNNRLYEIAGIPSGDESFLEVFFKGSDSTVANSTSNYWMNDSFRDENDPSFVNYGSYYRKEWVGLRVKGVSLDSINKVTNFMKDLENRKVQYNFQFIINRKDRYYCTDMMNRAYETIINNNSFNDISLNYDMVATTVNDLILSKHSYIAYYVTTDKNGIKYLYFIDN